MSVIEICLVRVLNVRILVAGRKQGEMKLPLLQIQIDATRENKGKVIRKCVEDETSLF